MPLCPHKKPLDGICRLCEKDPILWRLRMNKNVNLLKYFLAGSLEELEKKKLEQPEKVDEIEKDIISIMDMIKRH